MISVKSRRKREHLKRIVAIACAILVILAFAASIIMPAAMAVSRADVDDAKRETEEARDDMERAERERQQALEEYNALEQQITDTNTEIANVKNEIKQTNLDIEQKEAELIKAEEDYKNHLEAFKIRARAMYENTDVDYLEILFGAKDFGDLLSKIEIISQIMKYDQDILTKIEETKNQIIKTKEELNVKRTLLEASMAELEVQRLALEAMSAEKQKMLDEIAKDVEMYRIIYEAKEAAEAAAIKEYESALQYSANPVAYTGGKFMWPVPSTRRITSAYGYRIHPVYGTRKFHAGIDIGAALGADIVAAADGVVTLAATNGGYGQCIIINHGSGISTLYGHNSELEVVTGDKVVKGQIIAKAGSTGVSTGPHLHFEVRVNGGTDDPMNYF